MCGSVLVQCIVLGALTVATQASGVRDISNTLQVKLRLNKQEIRVGEEIVARFTITNISKRDVSVVTTGALYMAYWFRVEGSEGRVWADALFEKLFTDYVSREDVVTLKPGRSFTVNREAKLYQSQTKSGKAFLDFGDSGFELNCGTRYRLHGQFWARDERSHRFDVISGRLTSAPVNILVTPCK